MLCFTNLAERGAQPDDSVRLPFEARQKSIQRVVLDSGRDAGLLLPRGRTLHPGDLLLSDDGSVCLKVEAATEHVSVVYCKDLVGLARLCYHLGNRHLAVQIDRDGVRYLHDHVIDAMVMGLGFEVHTEDSPFEPEAGAYANRYEHNHAH